MGNLKQRAVNLQAFIGQRLKFYRGWNSSCYCFLPQGVQHIYIEFVVTFSYFAVGFCVNQQMFNKAYH